MTITEPMTMATDYALAALCLVLAVHLWTLSRRVGLWIAAFLVTALAAILGGTAHGFRIPLGEHWQVVWTLTVWSIAAGSVLLVAAGVRSVLRSDASSEAKRREGIRWLKWAIAVSLAGLAVLVTKLSIHEHFNKNDLYHLIQMGGLYCLYRGALRLHNLPSAISRQPSATEGGR